MKITKKQRKEIITQAKTELKQQDYLCIALSSAIADVLGVCCYSDIKDIQEYFPRFKKLTAIIHFHAKDEHAWWGKGDKQNRLRFLRYLLNGKLPKVKR
jgi:hypothetical protein